MITLLLLVIVLGVALYIVEAYLPMAQPLKYACRVIVLLIIVFYLLRLFNITDATFR